MVANLGGDFDDVSLGGWKSVAGQPTMAVSSVPDLAALRVRDWWQQQIGTDWEIGHQLGHGSSGQVWELISTADNQKYAGKLISKKKHWTTEQHLSKSEKEVSMQELTQAGPYGPNDHIVKVMHDILQLQNGDLMVIEELLPGGNLLQKLDQYREDRKLKDVFRQIVAGVKQIHEAGVVHRDLKLQNIFCNEDRSSPTCKIGDFGSATLFPLTREEQVARAGSAAFKSPEIYRSHLEEYGGKEADVWAVGVIFYRMLYDSYPFDSGGENPDLANTDDEIAALVSGAIAHTTEKVPADASFLISRMLDVNPHTRYTIQQVAADPFLQPDEDVINYEDMTW